MNEYSLKKIYDKLDRMDARQIKFLAIQSRHDERIKFNKIMIFGIYAIIGAICIGVINHFWKDVI